MGSLGAGMFAIIRNDMAETEHAPEDRAPKPGSDIDRVGSTLRQAYAEAASEPLPQAFEDLLRQLR